MGSFNKWLRIQWEIKFNIQVTRTSNPVHFPVFPGSRYADYLL